MRKVSSKSEFDSAINSPKLTVAVFKADWCGDCKFIDPFMPDVEGEFAKDLNLIEVDVDHVGTVSEEQNILGIPSFVAYADGSELTRYVNKLRKSREEIEQFLQRAVEEYNTRT
ncbi:thiol reductase thioredoxin [Paenibacillus helianthi]|uniref:Thiol reductase thioredoxin n=1 Tax=Paenibacillus helianthi TaxID=1349432 RepID=A0ABX3ESU2_9BACL|nr:thioredoxin family protein [Paenibacillus helianthi]OKP91013.1 thiol reductase thioredoxin [Paenibacillus helianthi]